MAGRQRQVRGWVRAQRPRLLGSALRRVQTERPARMGRMGRLPPQRQVPAPLQRWGQQQQRVLTLAWQREPPQVWSQLQPWPWLPPQAWPQGLAWPLASLATQQQQQRQPQASLLPLAAQLQLPQPASATRPAAVLVLPQGHCSRAHPCHPCWPGTPAPGPGPHCPAGPGKMPPGGAEPSVVVPQGSRPE